MLKITTMNSILETNLFLLGDQQHMSNNTNREGLANQTFFRAPCTETEYNLVFFLNSNVGLTYL